MRERGTGRSARTRPTPTRQGGRGEATRLALGGDGACAETNERRGGPGAFTLSLSQRTEVHAEHGPQPPAPKRSGAPGSRPPVDNGHLSEVFPGRARPRGGRRIAGRRWRGEGGGGGKPGTRQPPPSPPPRSSPRLPPPEGRPWEQGPVRSTRAGTATPPPRPGWGRSQERARATAEVVLTRPTALPRGTAVATSIGENTSRLQTRIGQPNASIGRSPLNAGKPRQGGPRPGEREQEEKEKREQDGPREEYRPPSPGRRDSPGSLLQPTASSPGSTFAHPVEPQSPTPHSSAGASSPLETKLKTCHVILTTPKIGPARPEEELLQG